MIPKEGISVYHPKDALEKAIQNAHHKYSGDSGGWLTSFECRLAAKAIASLKLEGDWIHEEELFDTRATHFFAPEMLGDGEEVVFSTYIFFLRDILENRKISAYLNNPIVLTSKQIAFYLFKEYPLHIIIKLKEINDAEFIKVGGLYIFEDSIGLPASAISGIKINDEMNKEQIMRDIDQITKESNMRMNKVAVTDKGNGVWGLTRGIDLNLKANERVQNKLTKKSGIVYSVEPGDVGRVSILYDDGEDILLTKAEFVRNFIYGLGKSS